MSLVTGGAGFLGSHLVDALIAQGDEVIIVDNLSTGSLSNLATALRRARTTFVYLDVARSFGEIRQPIREAARFGELRRIFHFASPADPNAYRANPWETLSVDAIGTMSVIELAIEHGARLMYASTSMVDGAEAVELQPESPLTNVDSAAARRCFGKGKRLGEEAISAAAAERGLDGRIVRFFNCYGPRMSKADGRLIAALARAAQAGKPLPIHGDGRQTRSMMFVDDAIRMLLGVASAPAGKLEPVNIGSDDERTVLDIAKTFARIAGTNFMAEHLAPRQGEPQTRSPDLSRALSMGSVARTTLDEGLAKTVAWFRDSVPAYA